MAHPDNAFYGHAAALAAAAGLGRPPPILGHVQHGWQLGTGTSESQREVGWLPKLLWSDSNVLLAEALGLRHLRPIGAPFLYFDRLVAADAPVTPSEPSTIVYPLHGWEREAVVGAHDRLGHEIREREPGAVTICLYWVEHALPAVRAAYEQLGFRVVCHGRRDDPTFLARQHAELRRHTKVVTNWASTALFYGMWLGLAGEVYGPRFTVRSTEEADRREAIARARWPQLFAGPVSGPDAVALAADELGARHLLDADDLHAALGWGRGAGPNVAQRGALHAARVAARGEHLVRAAAARRPRRRPEPYPFRRVLDLLEHDPHLGLSVAR